MADYTFQDAIDELEHCKRDRADLLAALRECSDYLRACQVCSGPCSAPPYYEKRERMVDQASALLVRLEKGERPCTT